MSSFKLSDLKESTSLNPSDLFLIVSNGKIIKYLHQL